MPSSPPITELSARSLRHGSLHWGKFRRLSRRTSLYYHATPLACRRLRSCTASLPNSPKTRLDVVDGPAEASLHARFSLSPSRRYKTIRLPTSYDLATDRKVAIDTVVVECDPIQAVREREASSAWWLVEVESILRGACSVARSEYFDFHSVDRRLSTP